jgi:hypothetical protein
MRILQTTYRNSDDIEGFWIKPKSITSNQRSQVIDYLHAARAANPPVAEGWLKARIATLLSHYYHATNDVNINMAVATDWVDCLRVFPQAAIEKACAQWRDTEKRKPTPSDIRSKAIAAFGEIEWNKLMRLKELAELPIVEAKSIDNQPDEWAPKTPEEKARVSKLVPINLKILSGAKAQDLTHEERNFCRENGIKISGLD